jgi:hypothetical protein
MSLITFHIGKENYSYNSSLFIGNLSLIAFEHCLIEDIREYMENHKIQGVIHDIVFVDNDNDNNVLAYAKDFEKIESLTIKTIRQK